MIRAWANKNSGEVVEFRSETATKSELAYEFLEYVGFEPLANWEEIPAEEDA